MADVMTIQGLTKNFGGLCAVDHFSMSITDDSIHALIGPNGSGKTTTINMISGVIPADRIVKSAECLVKKEVRPCAE